MIDLWPIQSAVFDALTGAPATYPVYDAVPQSPTFPYITIGEISGLNDLDIDAASADATLQIHGWSKSGGKAQAHAILAFIRVRLDRQQIGGAWAFFEEQVDVFEDRSSTAASRLYHSVARYRIRTN